MPLNKTVFTITNQTNRVCPATFLRRAPALLKAVQVVAGVKMAEVSLVLVDSLLIKQLNRRYRRINKVTDILSFTYQVAPVKGELIICLEQAARQAKRRRQSLSRELSLLLVHGLLHLNGYDHKKLNERRLMRRLEKKIISYEPK